HGRFRRPFLTTRNKLMGVGRFAEGPNESAEYRRGYLCGMIRGDAHPARYISPRGKIAYRFRLALVDLEGLQRARRYLSSMNVATTEFLFQQAVGARKELRAIRAYRRASIETIQGL